MAASIPVFACRLALFAVLVLGDWILVAPGNARAEWQGPVRQVLVAQDSSGDELLDDEDELLDDDAVEDKKEAEEEEPDAAATAREAHDALFAESRFPSASTCGSCHPKHFEEWSVSQHAYSQLSPIYLALNNKINVLANGSNGDFCLRCHNQVGANIGESSIISNLDRHPTSREGITCVVCHRINKDYNKASGRLALVEGGLTEPVYGPSGNAELARVLDNRHIYRVVTDPDERGRKIHDEVRQFKSISSPVFCGTCHDVTLFNGFRLEEAFSEYRMSPASARGVTCQDCHMGKVQGVASGYEFGPAAVVGGEATTPRKITNHFFAGPDYSVIHPGIFPHNAEAQQMATLAEWLQFDHEAGWGTDAFEDAIPESNVFSERWRAIDDRYDARGHHRDPARAPGVGAREAERGLAQRVSLGRRRRRTGERRRNPVQDQGGERPRRPQRAHRVHRRTRDLA